MKKINWYPDYWTVIEKNKLFDFWRSRYCKNRIQFSPNNENCGGIGFFDASYESLKYPIKNRYKNVKEEYLNRKNFLLNEFNSSTLQDKERLMLLIEAEEKAFEYFKAKMVLKPIEDDIPSILKQSIWLIDDKERIFKEAFSNLIEYDRKFISPLSFPERSLIDNPISISESYYWLIRDERKFPFNSQDNIFFNKNLHLISPFENKVSLLHLSFEPELLVNRHIRAISREKLKGIERSKNGDFLQDGKYVNYFHRPETIYNEELKGEDLQKQIKKFKDLDINKYQLNYDNDIYIFKDEKDILEKKIEDINSFKEYKKVNYKEIPVNPYLILHQNIYKILETGSLDEKNNILLELKNFIKERKRVNQLKHKSVKALETEENDSSFFEKIYYFFFDKNKNILQKELEPNSTEVSFNKDKFLKIDDFILLEEKNINDEEKNDFEEFLPSYEDEFDDKTRFKFFIRDKHGLHFNRKLAIKNAINLKNKIVDKTLEISNKLKLKNLHFILEMKEKIKNDKKVKLKLETVNDIVKNKIENKTFQEKIEILKKNLSNKNNEELKNNNKLKPKM